MSRRRRESGSFLADVGGAFLRLSHRVPLIGLIVGLAALGGWWYFRSNPQVLAAKGLGIACLVVAIFFGFIAVVGFLRNLFPDPGGGRRGRG